MEVRHQPAVAQPQGTLAAQARPALLRARPSRPQAALVGRPQPSACRRTAHSAWDVDETSRVSCCVAVPAAHTPRWPDATVDARAMPREGHHLSIAREAHSRRSSTCFSARTKKPKSFAFVSAVKHWWAGAVPVLDAAVDDLGHAGLRALDVLRPPCGCRPCAVVSHNACAHQVWLRD